MTSTKDVLERHLSCFAACDLHGIMADYTADAVLFAPDGPRRGAAEIERYFEGMFGEFTKPGVSFAMEQQVVDGDYAYIVWTAETADNVYEMGTDTFVVRDGRIVAQTFAGKITPKR